MRIVITEFMDEAAVVGLAERFDRMLDLLPEHTVVANLPNPHREARAVDAMLLERAESGRLVLVDIRREGPRSLRGRLASDKFHPNDQGYADLATIVERAVQRAGLLGRP